MRNSIYRKNHWLIGGVRLMLATKGLSYASRNFPEKTAIIDGNHQFSYQEFASRTAKVKQSLIQLQVHKGDRVAQLMLNEFRYLEVTYGVMAAGAIIVPLNTRLNLVEIVDILNDSGAEVLYLHKEFLSIIPELKTQVKKLRHIILAEDEDLAEGFNGIEGVHSYEPLLREQKEEIFIVEDIHENDVAGIFYTGGTTGRSKGVMLTHKNIVTNAFHCVISLPYTENDTYLHAAPMFHLAEAGGIFGTTMVGGTHAFIRSFTPRDVLETINKIKPTCMLLVPTMINMLIHSPDFAQYDVSALKKLLYGGSPMAPELLKKCARLMPQVEFYQGYGMTEAAPMLSLLKSKDHVGKRLVSCGQTVQGVEMKVVDSKGNELPAGEIGEFIAKGPNIMKGYWNLPEETSKAIRDGWYYTGDMGYKDDDEFFYIVDRAKDMIISGGENVYSAEVESVLYKHPLVLECAVIGVPDAKWGEAVKAAVVLKSERSVTEEELILYVRQHLANYKVPKSVDFMSELPKSGPGKILKREIRKQYWNGQSRVIN